VTENGKWSSIQATELYGVDSWGAGYFSISEKGEVSVHPDGPGGASVSLMDVARGIQERGFDLPVLVRLSDILDARIKQLHESFSKAIAEYNYQGCYRGVYPIKVNQQQQVVEEICVFGARYHHGLEAGSKAELIAAMSFLQDPEAYLICNGYKDEEFIDLGLYALKMGVALCICNRNAFGTRSDPRTVKSSGRAADPRYSHETFDSGQRSLDGVRW
jgi:arginine decarboxylase